MKLTDKDLLEDALQGAIIIMKAKGIDMISPRVPLAIIKDAPTIEAIPVEWLRGLKEKLYGNSNGLAYRMLLDVILNMWQKEQEART